MPRLRPNNMRDFQQERSNAVIFYGANIYFSLFSTVKHNAAGTPYAGTETNQNAPSSMPDQLENMAVASGFRTQ